MLPIENLQHVETDHHLHGHIKISNNNKIILNLT